MQLVKYDAACRAIAEAKAVDEVLDIRDKSAAIAAAAKIAKNHALEIDAAEIRIRAERRLGEMIREQKETVGLNKGAKGSVVTGSVRVPVKDDKPTLAQAGIDKKLSARSQHIASIPQDEFEETLATHREEQKAVTARTMETLAKKAAHVSHNSGENEWYTPAQYIEAAREVMGSIDTDPASCELANKTVMADRYYTIDDNGTEKPWAGNVFMNPPYSQPQIRNFSEAVAMKYKAGEIGQAIVLVNNATETEWFRVMANQASAVCFPAGRIRFIDKNGKPSGAPLQGQAFLYMGDAPDIFRSVFKKFGWVCEVAQ